jgi:2-keto-4-pentenoate hydratase/2-oxohepta-3-ene-1,7-dioic acid hydratase in catechol pathway
VKLARVADNAGAVWLARIDPARQRAELLARESAHPAADVIRESLHARIDLDAAGRDVGLDSVQLLPPVARPSKILAIGLNYADHARESAAEAPAAPLIFSKAPSSIVGTGQEIRRPPGRGSQVDYEAELAVVIRERTGGEPADPLRHVLGYTVCNDVSARDVQFRDGQWTRGKSFDTFCSLGPWIVTADEIPDVQSLGLGTRINGETLQDGTTADMIFTVEDIVRYVAGQMTLEPGDVIATGTPSGVGFARRPPRFLVAGDRVECWVERVGQVTNPVTGQ